MNGFKESLEKEMHSAARRLSDKGFGRFETEYIGYIVSRKKDGEEVKGHCYRITDPKSGEKDVVLIQDNGSVLEIKWGDDDDKGRV